MITNVPQITFGATGPVAPSDAAILAGVQADINADFGGGLVFTTVSGGVTNSTPQGQLASSWAAIISNTFSEFVFLASQFDPAFSQGRYQDGLGRIYFITRKPALPTILNINCIGAQGVVIPVNALITDINGFQYYNTNAGTIPPSGSVTLQFANLAVGPIPVPSSNNVSIVSVIPGWDAVTCLGGTLGQNTENAQQFETRRGASVAGNSQGQIGSIIGAVAAVPGVVDFFGYNNGTTGPVTINGVSVPANSIYIAVSGGAQQAVAQAILSKLGGGCGTSGTTTVTAFDNNPLYAAPVPYSIKFTIPSSLQVLVNVNLVSNPNIPANAATLIQNQIIAAAAGTVVGSNGLTVPRARINSLILASAFINAIQALGPWVQVRSLTLGSVNNAAATFTGSITGGTLTTSGVTGTIAVNQQVADTAGNVPPGVFITGGTGPTYTVNNTTITVGSEAMYSSAVADNSEQVHADQEPSFVAGNINVVIA